MTEPTASPIPAAASAPAAERRPVVAIGDVSKVFDPRTGSSTPFVTSSGSSGPASTVQTSAVTSPPTGPNRTAARTTAMSNNRTSMAADPPAR